MRVETSETFARGGRAAFVVGLHVAFVYVLATGLGIVKPPELIKPIEAFVLDPANPTEPPKPIVANPHLARHTLDLPLPEPLPVIEDPVEAAQPTQETMTFTDPGPPQPSLTISDANLKVVRRVDPVYPPAARRADEQGTGVFSVLVDESGHPKEVTVKTSTGHDRLDQAAMEAIRRWVFNPAVRGSQKTTAWTSVKVTFQLQTY